jgi:N-acetylglucosamine-6-phosphate deacetylase
MSKARRHAVAADTVFDGTDQHRDCAVIIENGDIVALAPRRELPADISVLELPDGVWLAPGFIDVQVNGGGDVLFNDAPTTEAILAIVAAHRRFGTTSLLPTLISDTTEKMRAASAALTAAMARDPGVLGIHFEGPFLSPERAGVHDPALLREPTAEDMEIVLAPRPGTTLVTLAPERVPPGFVARLIGAGIRLALGHSMATYAETRAALAEGLTGFTHLFNAMRSLSSREPGPIAAALETPEAFYGLIVDGEHVAAPMLRLALRGLGQPMLVTDAMPPVGGTGASFTLCGKEVLMRDGRCITADGTLAGAALDMATAVRNSLRLLRLELPQVLRLASAAPAAFLGIADRLGHLAPGYRADMVALDPTDIRVLASWVAGHEFSSAAANV